MAKQHSKRLDNIWSAKLGSKRIRQIASMQKTQPTDDDLSESADIASASVSRICRGQWNAGSAIKSCLADTLGVAPESLQVIDVCEKTKGGLDYNRLMRLLVQTGWLFGLEPSKFGSGKVVVTDAYVTSAMAEWAEVRSSLSARDSKMWAYRFGVDSTDKGWEDEVDCSWRGTGAVLPANIAVSRAADRNTWYANHTGKHPYIKHFAKDKVSNTLANFKSENNLTFSDIENDGIKTSQFANALYGNTLPLLDTAKVLAEYIGVDVSTLVTFDIATPLQFVHMLMDIAEAFSLTPEYESGEICLKPIDAATATKWVKLIDSWGEAWGKLVQGNTQAYKRWYNTYDAS